MGVQRISADFNAELTRKRGRCVTIGSKEQTTLPTCPVMQPLNMPVFDLNMRGLCVAGHHEL